jgi:hypothetical protein
LFNSSYAPRICELTIFLGANAMTTNKPTKAISTTITGLFKVFQSFILSLPFAEYYFFIGGSLKHRYGGIAIIKSWNRG